MSESNVIRIEFHESTFGPNGDMSVDGGLVIDHLEMLAARYDRGENIRDIVIITRDHLKHIWDHAMKTGDFTCLTDDFIDSLAAIEDLIRRERNLERYVSIFGQEPEPILNPADDEILQEVLK